MSVRDIFAYKYIKGAIAHLPRAPQCSTMTVNTSIPKTQRVCILPSAGSDVSLRDDHPVVQPEELLPGQCLVKLTHSGVCHSDLYESSLLLGSIYNNLSKYYKARENTI